jgi:CrcB protein
MAPDLTLRAALLVAAGAVAGALCRWVLGAALPRAFPSATMPVNLTGSFLVGLVLFGGVARGWLGEDARILLAVGFLGALTTMSAFAYETVAALDEDLWGRAALLFLANPVLSLAAAYLGLLAGRALPLAAS